MLLARKKDISRSILEHILTMLPRPISDHFPNIKMDSSNPSRSPVKKIKSTINDFLKANWNVVRKNKTFLLHINTINLDKKYRILSIQSTESMILQARIKRKLISSSKALKKK